MPQTRSVHLHAQLSRVTVIARLGPLIELLFHCIQAPMKNLFIERKYA